MWSARQCLPLSTYRMPASSEQARTASGSSASPRAVEPVTSLNKIVTTLRASRVVAAGASSLVPHSGQNFGVATSSAPQDGHAPMTASVPAGSGGLRFTALGHLVRTTLLAHPLHIDRYVLAKLADSHPLRLRRQLRFMHSVLMTHDSGIGSDVRRSRPATCVTRQRIAARDQANVTERRVLRPGI